MKRTRRNRGFILLLVVAMIPLVGMMMAILSVNSKTLAFETRRGALQIHARQACESGLAWARLNTDRIKLLKPQESIDLPVTHERLAITCSIALTDEHGTDRVIEITGFAEDSRLKSHVSRQLTVPF